MYIYVLYIYIYIYIYTCVCMICEVGRINKNKEITNHKLLNG